MFEYFVPTNECINELANGPYAGLLGLRRTLRFLLDITKKGLMKIKRHIVCITNISPFLFDTAARLECQKATIRSIVALQMRHSLLNEVLLADWLECVILMHLAPQR